MKELFIQNWVFTGKGYGTSLDDILKTRFAYYGVPYVDPCDPTQTCAPLIPNFPLVSTGATMSIRTASHFNSAVQVLLDRIQDLEDRLDAALIP